MSLKFKLRKNNIKSNKSYGKWYAHTLRGSEVTLDEIEQQIQDCCSVTRADVRAVVTALQEVVARDLTDGHVVSLGELGKFYLSIRSESVDNPEEFSVQRHVKGIVCNYIPEGHRRSNDRHITRPFTDNCHLEQVSIYDENGHVAKRIRRGGWIRK